MPDGYQSDDWYQTKSMECLMIDYEVDEAGQLWELGVGGCHSPEGKNRFPIPAVFIFTKTINTTCAFQGNHA